MSRIRLLFTGVALASVTAISAFAFADDDDHCKRHEPPPEAFAACDSKADGDVCSVTFHDSAHAGTCHAPEGKRLACLPNDMPHHPPPPDR
jgi:hypothetical protein